MPSTLPALPNVNEDTDPLIKAIIERMQAFEKRVAIQDMEIDRLKREHQSEQENALKM